MNALTPTPTTGAGFPAYAPDSAAPKSESRLRRLPWGRILPVAAILVVAASAAGSYLRYASGFVTTDDSFLEGDVHPVSPRINGTVSRVLVDDNAHVVAGQPLVQIDPADLGVAVQSCEADLARARANETEVAAQIQRAGADLEAARARVAQNAAQLNLADIDLHRSETLVTAGAVSRQSFDESRAAFEAAQAAQQSLVSVQTSAQAGLAAAQAQRAVAHAEAQKAEAALHLAQLQVDYTVIRAPSAGHVAKKTVEVGQRLQPGQPVMAIVSDDVWVVANFKENQLARLKAGDKAEVRVDAESGRVLQGVVESFSPGTGATFSLLPPDNATGNFTKIVQRLPVKILLTGAPQATSGAPLAPGLSAEVRVSVGE